MKKFFTEIFQDHASDPGFSAKRFVTIMCAMVLIGIALTDLTTDLTVSQYMFESLMYIVISGLGITGAELFVPKKGE